MATKKLLRAKIEISRREVAEAEEHLSKVLGATRKGAPRAEKTTVTEAVREALAKLRAARAELDEVAKIVGVGD